MTETSQGLLDISGLNIAIRSHGIVRDVVRDFNFQIAPGETVGIVGESGSGKTMAMLALTRLLPKQAFVRGGTMRLGGQDLAGLNTPTFHQTISGKRISMIFQEPMTALNPVYTIGRQLTETVKYKEDLSRSEATRRAIEMLENVQLPNPEERMHQYPHQLSGGQRQRVMIAMALMNKPDLLIADEPTTALDVTVQNEIIQLLMSLQKKFGMAMIFISHDLGVVARVSQRIVVMCRGDVVEEGATSSVLSAPRHGYTRSLLSCLWKLEDGHPEASEISETRNALVKVEGINKSYTLSSGLIRRSRQVQAVKSVSFEVFSGETVAIVGESGSGKSTLAKILNGLLAPDDGMVLFEGIPIGRIAPLQRASLVQPIFQDPYSTLNPHHTIGAIVARPLRIHERPSVAEQRQRVLSALESVGLSEDYYNRYPNQLSGGQRQRVAIARAIICKPRILICDEPTSALDVSVQEQILDLLKDLQDELGMTMILISHDMAVVRYLADRVFVMLQGEVVERGKAQDVLDTPSHAYTQKLMQSVYKVPRAAAVPPVAPIPAPGARA